MNRLSSYLIASVLKATALVALVLVAVASVLEFVGQLDDVGVGSYGVGDALVYVALRTPVKLFDVLPAAALIGSLLGLGNMAVHRELVVMRASGVSHVRLLGAAAAAGLVLFVVMALLGESLAPKLGSYARTARADAVLEEVDSASPRSDWVKEGDRYFIHLTQPESGEGVGQRVRLFELNGDRTLRRVVEGILVSTSGQQTWNLVDYAETSFSATGIASRTAPSMQQNYGFGREVVALTDVPAYLLELTELGRLIRDLESRGVDASAFLAAYWGRVAAAVSVVLMTMLALPFVLGSLRSVGAGARMAFGLVIGLAYYVLGELSINIGEVFSLDPIVAAWTPSAILFVVTGLAVLRLR
jgi:lipopolysaccharide export system permease protein